MSRQKLETLTQEVFPAISFTDPLIEDPVRIIDADWANGVLEITLNQNVTKEWVHCVSKGGHNSLMGHGPETFKYTGNQAHTTVRADIADKVLDYFRQWLPNANACYKREKEEAAKQ